MPDTSLPRFARLDSHLRARRRDCCLVVAQKTLKDAEEFWKQQKWFDLYAKADEGYDTFEFYCTTYKGTKGIGTTQQDDDWNNLMLLIRRVHSMAMVFPKHPAIEKLAKIVQNTCRLRRGWSWQETAY